MFAQRFSFSELKKSAEHRMKILAFNIQFFNGVVPKTLHPWIYIFWGKSYLEFEPVSTCTPLGGTLKLFFFWLDQIHQKSRIFLINYYPKFDWLDIKLNIMFEKELRISFRENVSIKKKIIFEKNAKFYQNDCEIWKENFRIFYSWKP